MHTLATIRRWKLKRFTVVVTAHEETDLDLSWDDDGATQRGLRSGEFVAFCVKAAVYLDGNEIANDYLGNCVYRSFAEFMDHAKCAEQNREYARKGEAGRCGSYFADMVHNVIADARKHVAAIKPVHVRVA